MKACLLTDNVLLDNSVQSVFEGPREFKRNA